MSESAPIQARAPDLRPVHRAGGAGRYAPSPTGDLHLGNVRAALEAWRDCRERGDVFILRVEDLDGPRTVPGSEERILDDLRWIGIDWDEGPDKGGPAGPYRQSERGAVYEAALERLKRLGLVYPCSCSRKDLREASAPHGEGEPAYPGTCRSRDPMEVLAHPAGAAWRFRAEGLPPVEFTDGRAGPVRFDLARTGGDFVVRRRDGLWAYQLACAADDWLMGVTRVVRGADLLESAARQIAILRALGGREPEYVHLPLVLDERGERMSKRGGSAALRALRERGFTPEEARDAVMRAPAAG